MQDRLTTPGDPWTASRRGLLARGIGIGIAAAVGAAAAAGPADKGGSGGDSGDTAHGGIIHTNNGVHGGIAQMHHYIGHTHPAMVHTLDQ